VVQIIRLGRKIDPVFPVSEISIGRLLYQSVLICSVELFRLQV